MELGKITLFCAALMALAGMAMGMGMGITQDFTLVPVHAHLNLVGWVTMAIYGLYHSRLHGHAGRLRWIQVATGGIGAPLMAAGLALLLTSPADSEGHLAGEAATIAGSSLAMLSMLLFAGIVASDLVGSAWQRLERAKWGLPDVDPVSG